MVIYGVDAHTEYQAGLSVPSLPGEGYGFAIFKATQGATGYTAPALFDSWVRQARSAGLVVGAYHWLTSVSGAAQADHFINRVAATGYGPNEFLLCVDVEDTQNPPTLQVLQAFFARMATRLPGKPIVLYTGQWWWDVAGRRWNGAALTPYLWLSKYVSGAGTGAAQYAKVPASWWSPGFGGWSRATILQYTSNGTAAGITANVDLNAFDQDISVLRALASAGSPAVSATPKENEVFLAQFGASIILTDGGTWTDTPSLADVNALHSAGIAWVNITDAYGAHLMELPRPGSQPPALTLTTEQATAIGTAIGDAMAGIAGITPGQITAAVTAAMTSVRLTVAG